CRCPGTRDRRAAGSHPRRRLGEHRPSPPRTHPGRPRLPSRPPPNPHPHLPPGSVSGYRGGSNTNLKVILHSLATAGFRRSDSATILFGEATFLIGPNNAGKSSVLK